MAPPPAAPSTPRARCLSVRDSGPGPPGYPDWTWRRGGRRETWRARLRRSGGRASTSGRNARAWSGAGWGFRSAFRVPGLLGELGERGGAGDGELRQALAIERHAGVLQTADERAVRQSVLAGRGVDAHHPQPPEITLLAPTSDEGVLERRVDGLFRGAIQ